MKRSKPQSKKSKVTVAIFFVACVRSLPLLVHILILQIQFKPPTPHPHTHASPSLLSSASQPKSKL